MLNEKASVGVSLRPQPCQAAWPKQHSSEHSAVLTRTKKCRRAASRTPAVVVSPSVLPGPPLMPPGRIMSGRPARTQLKHGKTHHQRMANNAEYKLTA
jgi:hypothetical protein